MTYLASYLLIGMVLGAITIRAYRFGDVATAVAVFFVTVCIWPVLLVWWAAFESVEDRSDD